MTVCPDCGHDLYRHRNWIDVTGTRLGAPAACYSPQPDGTHCACPWLQQQHATLPPWPAPPS